MDPNLASLGFVPRVLIAIFIALFFLVSKASYLSFFPKQGRENLVIAVPSDGGDVLSKQNLGRALELFEEISAISITYEVSSF